MNKRQLFVSGFIITCVAVLTYCTGKGGKQEKDPRGQAFAAATTCVSCHREIYENFRQTAHHNTSSPSDTGSVKGSFVPPGNAFHFSGNRQVLMELRDSGLFQTAYENGTAKESRRFDITIGSGRKAQTFLYWENDHYYQLPVSWFVPANSWANSPGFPPDHAKFDRVIPSECFGCHSSMAGMKEVRLEGLRVEERFLKNELIYGIDCQRCHGAAAEHVAFHTENPGEEKAMHITRIAALSNRQQLDMCALCHSGLGDVQKSAFQFKPGDALSDYFFPAIGAPVSAAKLDVHGNQFQLFTASKCYTSNRQTMNCSGCHDTHRKETNNMQLFSARCMTCHTEKQETFCKLQSLPAAVLQQNCIDCHMPNLPSGAITLLANGESSPTPDSIRTHLIKIYPEAANKIIKMMKKG